MDPHGYAENQYCHGGYHSQNPLIACYPYDEQKSYLLMVIAEVLAGLLDEQSLPNPFPRYSDSDLHDEPFSR